MTIALEARNLVKEYPGVLAVAGVAVALLDEPPAIAPDALAGDVLCILGSLCWAGIAITARISRLNRSEPEMQLIYQLAVSGPVLLLLAPFFGRPARCDRSAAVLVRRIGCSSRGGGVVTPWRVARWRRGLSSRRCNAPC